MLDARDMCNVHGAAAAAAPAAAVEAMTTGGVFRAFRARRLYPKATHEIVMSENNESTGLSPLPSSSN